MRLAALYFVAGVLLAQTDPAPREQAWTAHSILEQRLTSRIPDLVRILESPDSSSDADAAKFAVLDALIQLDAQVPLADLEPLIDRFPTDVFILASRSAEDATPLLLKLLDRPHNREAFIAIGNLLTPKRVPGFAKTAMKEFCQHATLYVVNPDRPRNTGGAWSGDSYRMTDPQRDGWPETGSYRFGPGSFIRTVDRSYIDHGFDFSNENSHDNSCITAAEFLATYLDTSPPRLPILATEAPDVTFTGEQAFETSVRAFIAEQRQRYAILASQLAAHGYLTLDEASQLRLTLWISVSEARQHDRTALPDVTAWAK
ncbi:MAG: hypothetical protein ACLPWF_29110 [Bryobacteraceae bacterium]